MAEFEDEILFLEKPDIADLIGRTLSRLRPPRFPWLKPDRRSLDACRRCAQGGVAEAQRDMGLRYLEGVGVKRDRRKAVEWLARAAEQGDADACIHLGSPFEHPDGPCVDAKRGVEWLRRAADAGSVRAKVALADCLARGRGVERDPGQAILLAAGPAGDGMPEACAVLATCHIRWGNDETAIPWLTRAAEGGVAEAMFDLGRFLVVGRGVEQDRERGMGWVLRAAGLGHGDAIDSIREIVSRLEKAHARREEELERAERELLPSGMGLIGPQTAAKPSKEEKKWRERYAVRAERAHAGGAEAQLALGEELLAEGREDFAVIWLAMAAGRGLFRARVLLNPLLALGGAAVPIETDEEGRPVGNWNRAPAVETGRLPEIQLKGGRRGFEAGVVMGRQITACRSFHAGRRQEAEARAREDGDDPVKKLCRNIGPEADHLRGKDFAACLAAAEAGDLRACAVAGACLLSGQAGAEKDPAAGAAWLRRASDGGVAMASEMLGLRLLEGEDAERDGEEGMRRLLMAADAGRASAMVAAARRIYEGLGDRLGGGSEEAVREEGRVFSLLRRAALLDDLDAQYRLALCHAHGIGTRQDLTAFQEWEMRTRLAEYGPSLRLADGAFLNVLNRFKLLDVEYAGNGPNMGAPIPVFELPLPWAPEDYILPPKRKRSGEEVIRDDQRRLAEIRAIKAAREAGTPLTPDEEKALARDMPYLDPHDPDRFDVPVFKPMGWLDDLREDKEAAEACFALAREGDARACAELGFRYQEGIGVARSRGEAFKWLSRAAEKGDPDGQFFRGHWIGEDGDISKEYVTWLEKAAAQGHLPAMHTLGVSFSTGHGVRKDEKLALKWFQKAADAGYPPAMMHLGWAMARGMGGMPRDRENGVELLVEAAKLGFLDAMYAVGAVFNIRERSREEVVAGRKWVMLAASRGHEPSRKIVEQVAAAQYSGPPMFDDDGNYVGDLPMPDEDDGWEGRLQ